MVYSLQQEVRLRIYDCAPILLRAALLLLREQVLITCEGNRFAAAMGSSWPFTKASEERKEVKAMPGGHMYNCCM